MDIAQKMHALFALEAELGRSARVLREGEIVLFASEMEFHMSRDTHAALMRELHVERNVDMLARGHGGFFERVPIRLVDDALPGQVQLWRNVTREIPI